MWPLLLICAGVTAWPFGSASCCPFKISPNTFAAARTIHNLDDPSWHLSQYHVVDLSRTQYLSWYYAMDLLCWLMPLELANRLLLTAYVLAVPLSVYALLRALRRDTTVALLAVPLALNTYLYMGFMNYVTALPMVLLALALLVQTLRRWSPWQAAALTALTALMFYSHVQALLMYIGFAASSRSPCAQRAGDLRAWWRQSLHLLPTLLLLAHWMYSSRILASGAAWAEGHGGRNTTEAKFHFEPLMARIKADPSAAVRGLPRRHRRARCCCCCGWWPWSWWR